MRASLPDAASGSYSTGMDKGRWACGYEGCQSEGSSMVVRCCAGSTGSASLLSLFGRCHPRGRAGLRSDSRLAGMMAISDGTMSVERGTKTGVWGKKILYAVVRVYVAERA